MQTVLVLTGVLGICCLEIVYVYGVQVIVPTSIIGVKGKVQTFSCTYSLATGETSVAQIKWNKQTNANKVDIGSRSINSSGSITEDLFNINFLIRASFVSSTDSNDGSIQLTNLAVSDEGSYTCEVLARGGTGQPSTASASLEVDILPTKPHISLKSSAIITGRDDIMLNCIANLGRPNATLTWKMASGDGMYYDVGSGNNTRYTDNYDDTYNATSILTVNLDSETHAAYHFRCELRHRQLSIPLQSDVASVRGSAPAIGSSQYFLMASTAVTLIVLLSDQTQI